jgi:pyridoxal phosphate enzyme (YggS family)
MEVGLQDVLLSRRVRAGGLCGDEPLCFGRGHAQVEDQVLPRKPVDVVFEVLDPGLELVAFLRRHACGLVGEVGSDVAVGKDDFACFEGEGKARLGFEAITRVKKSGEMRIDTLEVAKIPIQKLADHLAKPGVVFRKARRIDEVTSGCQCFLEQLELGAFAAAVDAFDGDEFAGSCLHCSQSNRRRSVPQRRACYDAHSAENGDMTESSVRENLLRIQERVAAAAHKAGRRTEEVTLVGVSKTHPANAIREAYHAGLRHFGENRVQEWEGKRGGIDDLAATWHLIGHLQSNKAVRAARFFHCVDSVDDLELAQRLDRARHDQGAGPKMRVLLEVRVAAEETKSGVNAGELPALAEKVTMLPRLEFAGLMCIPPFLEDSETVRPYFRSLRELRDGLVRQLGRALPVLSMGMSHDFEVAIEEGATEVRVGTALFGQRPASQP